MKGKLVRYKTARLSMLLSGIIIIVLLTSLGRGPIVADKASLRIMFYNVENLFDTINSDLNDDEFLPEADRRWNSFKYTRKLNNISKVIISAGDWEPPSIIGLCEVENENVVSDLVSETILKTIDYQYIYARTADERGIGVALIYRKDFSILSSDILYPVYSSGDTLLTRTVLYAKLTDNIDTLGLVITHWPSRRGGTTATEGLRKIVAGLIKERILKNESKTKVIILGDLNCEPDSEIVCNMINSEDEDNRDESFYNTSISASLTEMGSYKYQGMWLQYDQIILSNELLDADRGYSYKEDSFAVIRNSFLLTDDLTYRGLKPFATWVGPRYTGGFSDHLPVVIDLVSIN